MGGVTILSRTELRNHLGAVLRQVEGGATFTMTLSGRPVAELSPRPRRRWVSEAELDRVWRGPRPEGIEADLARFPGTLIDRSEA